MNAYERPNSCNETTETYFNPASSIFLPAPRSTTTATPTTIAPASFNASTAVKTALEKSISVIAGETDKN